MCCVSLDGLLSCTVCTDLHDWATISNFTYKDCLEPNASGRLVKGRVGPWPRAKARAKAKAARQAESRAEVE